MLISTLLSNLRAVACAGSRAFGKNSRSRRNTTRASFSTICYSQRSTETLEARSLLSGTSVPNYDLRLVVDINDAVQSSTPTEAVEFQGNTYFAASTPQFGSEVYRSDRTTAGTSILKDLVVDGDAYPKSLTVFGGSLYFMSSYTDPGPFGSIDPVMGLWKSDGTAAGTQLVKSFLLPGGGSGSGTSNSKPMSVVNGQLVFFVGDSMTGEELWATDGTSAGTKMLAVFDPSMSSTASDQLLTVGNLLYINRNIDTFQGGHELWRSDGTPEGTFVLRQVMMGSPEFGEFDPTLAAVSNTVFFVSTEFDGQELWKTNGTVSGTVQVRDILDGPMGSQPGGLTTVNGVLLFSAYDGLTGRELWKSDGTFGGTVPVKDIRPGSEFDSGISNSIYDSQFTAWNNKVYFVADDGINGAELWASDGTAPGTQMVLNVGTGTQGLWPGRLTALPNRLLVQTRSFGLFGSQLWASDGTAAGTQFVGDPDGTAGQLGSDYFVADGKAFFISNDGVHGNEIWVSDGTVAGTSLAKDVAPGMASGATQILSVGQSGVYFAANDGVHGVEPGYSDGTVAGTTVIDLATGTPASQILDLALRGDELFIASGKGLYHSLGDAASTTQLSTIVASSLTTVGARVFFTGSATSNTSPFNQELWVSDGTIAGTKLVKDIRSGSSGSDPKLMTAFEGFLYFVADDGTNGAELWRSSGGLENTALHYQFVAGAADGKVQRLLVVGDKLYVVADDILYVKTSSGFQALATTHPSTLMPWNDILYFAGETAATGSELWRTDGTVGGTYLIADINPGPGSSYPGGGVTLAPVGGGAALESRLVFRASVANGTSQLYTSDGTTAGTFALTDAPMVSGDYGASESLVPIGLTVAGGNVFFEAYRQDVGRELWVSNGTVKGTRLVADLRPGTYPDPFDFTLGSAYFNLKEMTAFGDRVFFRATSENGDVELWTSDGTAEGSGLAIDILPGTSAGQPTHLTVAGNKLYLAANTLDYGVGQAPSRPGELFRLNQAPESFDVGGTTQGGQTHEVPLRGTDADGDPLTFEVVTLPTSGTVSINGSSMVYTPNAGFVGADVFTYRAFDGSLYSAVSSVNVSVTSTPQRLISFVAATASTAERTGIYSAVLQLSEPAVEPSLMPFYWRFVGSDDWNEGLIGATTGDTITEAAIRLTDDNIYSADRQIEIAIFGNEFAAAGTITTHLVTITDNDSQPTVFFIDSQRTYRESDGTVSFDIGLSRPSDEPVQVSVGVFPALTTAGSDYIAAYSTVLTFLPGQQRQRVPVSIIDDTLPEGREAIRAQLSAISGTVVTSDPDHFRSIAYILDNDISEINVSSAVSLVREGESTVLTATRRGGDLSVALNVPLIQTSGDAGTTDYQLSASGFQFAAGATTAQITVTTTTDGVVEPFENLFLELQQPTGTQYVRGDLAGTYIGIYNIDSTTVSLAMSTLNLPGGTGSRYTSRQLTEHRPYSGGNWQVEVIATLSAPSQNAISVPVVVNRDNLPGYAKLGTDYSFVTTDFVFAPGVTEVKRVLTINNDFDVEPNETIQISLTPANFLRPGGPLSDEGLTGQLVILDDDFTPTITAPTDVTENAGAFQFTIDLGATVADTFVAVDVWFNGSLSRSEYAVAALPDRNSNSVTFLRGEQIKTFTVELIDDTIFEKTEELTISMYFRGDTVRKTVRINDNERPPTVNFIPPSNGFSLSGAGGEHVIGISLDRASDTRTELKLEFGGDAQRNVDYYVFGAAASGTILLGPGETYAEIEIYPANNTLATGDTTLNVSIVGGINILLPPIRPKTDRVIQGPSNPATKVFYEKPSVTTAKVGDVAISTNAEVGFILPDSNASGPNVGVSTPLGNAHAGTVLISTGQQGILSGSTVFFDANFNGTPDFLDLNQNGRQDDDEPTEPTATTDLSGAFAVTIPEVFDLDGSGEIEDYEGRMSLTGGIDTATDLPWQLRLTAPAGLYNVSPISTLLDTVSRRSGLSLDEATNRVNSMLNLGSFDPRSATSIYHVLASDPVAALAYQNQVSLSSATLLMSSVLSGKSGSSLQFHADAVNNLLADFAIGGGSSLDLSQAQVVQSLLNALNRQLSTPLTSDVLQGTAELTAMAVSRLNSLRLLEFSEPIEFLKALTRIKKLAHGELSTDLHAVGAGTSTISSVLSQYTSSSAPNFDSQAGAQVIGQIIPAVIGVSDAVVREGNNGTTALVFTVRLLGDHRDTVTVNYVTADGSANAADGDYTPTSGTLSWLSGDTGNRTVEVTVNSDTDFEVDEYLKLFLTDANNAVIRIQNGFGYIVNDDAFIATADIGGSEFEIFHGTDESAILVDGAVQRSGEFFDSLVTELTGATSADNSLTLDYSGDEYGEDHYTFHGGTAVDELTVVAGRFSRVIHRITDGFDGALTLQPFDDEATVVDWNSVEAVLAEVSTMDELIVHLPVGISQVIIDDPNPNTPGQMRVRSPDDAFPPIVFTVPNTWLTIASLNPATSLQVVSTDPDFIGTIRQIDGGSSLSNAVVAENLPPGTSIGLLSSVDPILTGAITFELVAGTNDSGNSYFTIDNGTLKTAAVFDFEVKSSYSVRVRTTDSNGLSLEQAFTITVTDVAEDMTPPVSLITLLPAASTSLVIPISVTGSDPGAGASGVLEYDLYVSSGSAFAKFATVPTSSPSTTFTGTANTTYWFRSLARDNAGNVETKTTSDTYTHIGDIVPPVTQVVSASAETTGLFTVQITGSKTGGQPLTQFDVYVLVDGGTATLIGTTGAGAANASGIHSSSVTWQGVADGASHSYSFYSVGRDGSGNVEATPALADLTVNYTFASTALTATGIDVQNGANQRSYVRHLDVLFSGEAGLDDLLATGRVVVERFDISAASAAPGSGTVVTGGLITRNANRLSLDFGATGLGGLRQAGNGFYRVMVDVDGDGSVLDDGVFFEFHRLFGDANGDGRVDAADTSLVTSQIGRVGVLDGDMDGNGAVNSLDRLFTIQQKNKKLLDFMLGLLDD